MSSPSSSLPPPLPVASFTKASALTPAQLAHHEAEAERHRLQQQAALKQQNEQPASVARALPTALPAGLLDDAASADTSSTFKRRRVYGMTPQLSAPVSIGGELLVQQQPTFLPGASDVAAEGLHSGSIAAGAPAGQLMEDGEHKTPAPVQVPATVPNDGAGMPAKRKEHATSEQEARAVKSPPPTAAELAAATVSAEEELMADVELSKESSPSSADDEAAAEGELTTAPPTDPDTVTEAEEENVLEAEAALEKEADNLAGTVGGKVGFGLGSMDWARTIEELKARKAAMQQRRAQIAQEQKQQQQQQSSGPAPASEPPLLAIKKKPAAPAASAPSVSK